MNIKTAMVEGFTKKYGVHRLVYYEVARDAETALSRERQIKNMESAMETQAD